MTFILVVLILVFLLSPQKWYKLCILCFGSCYIFRHYCLGTFRMNFKCMCKNKTYFECVVCSQKNESTLKKLSEKHKCCIWTYGSFLFLKKYFQLFTQIILPEKVLMLIYFGVNSCDQIFGLVHSFRSF